VRDLLEQAVRVGIQAEESDVGEAATGGDYLAWLAEDLEDGVEPAALHTLGLALGELRADSCIDELARNHGIHQALGVADRLRADYADLTAGRRQSRRSACPAAPTQIGQLTLERPPALGGSEVVVDDS